MKTYRSFAKALETLLAEDKAVRLANDPFMPLSIEDIGPSGDGRRQIAIAHTGVQNGDLMRDPEMVFEFFDYGDGITYAEPISFRNDYMGTYQEVYRYDETGKRTHVLPRLKQELKSFARLWFRNLRQQGFFGKGVYRERLD